VATGTRSVPITWPSHIKEFNMSLSESRCRARHAAAIVLASIAFAAGPAAAAPTPAFDEAMQHYQDGRWAAAYGRFSALADGGDIESARIALLMLRHGERLYGSTCIARTDQRLICSCVADHLLP
jgi:hypothetical protein